MSPTKPKKKLTGYQSSFIGRKYAVRLPELSDDQIEDLAFLKGTDSDYVLQYKNFSVVQNKQRKFPFFVAVNIDGNLFKKLKRADRWRLEPRINRKHQLGAELYSARKSDFDKGHMAKREDVQWGKSNDEARKGALDSFYYTNAIPQSPKLNRIIWKSLEDYILKKETLKNGLKINMFTGPVLSKHDPVFITKVKGEKIKIPTLFWKVIYFKRHKDQKLCRVCFLMGQLELLIKNGIVIPGPKSRGLFMKFKDAATYQVNINTIKTLTKLDFPPALELYKKDKPIPLNKIIKRVQARSIKAKKDSGPNYKIEGLVL